MTNHQRFTLLARDRAIELVGECKMCTGNGITLKNYKGGGLPEMLNQSPCPTCAPLREIASWDWKEEPVFCDCGLCNYPKPNPTFIIPDIRHTLEVLDLWSTDDGFVEHLRVTATSLLQVADILTSDSLCLQAACEYMEGRKG